MPYLQKKHDIGFVRATDPSLTLDIGSAADNRAGVGNATYTFIDLANPCDYDGTINSIQIWADTVMTGCRVGTFYFVSGTTYRCRASVTLGDVTAGSLQTFSSQSLAVKAGDFIGCYFATGKIELSGTGGSGILIGTGETIDAGDDTTAAVTASNAISLYATGVQTITIGLMLDKNGVPMYQVDEDQYIVDQFQTAQPDYGALSPQKEIALIQDSWNGGLGYDFYDRSHPKRISYGRGADTRTAQKAILGPTFSTGTLPVLSITDGGMELWTDATTLTNWTKTLGGSGALDRDDANEHGGTYSARLQSPGAPDSVTLYKDAVTWDTSWRRKTVTFTAWVKATNAVSPLQINDGASTTTGSAHTGGGAYEQLHVTHFVADAATQCRIQFYISGALNFVYVDDVALMTKDNTSALCEFDSDLFFNSGDCLYRVNTSGTISFQASFPAEITDLCYFPVSDTDYLFVALGKANFYYYMQTNEVFYESNLANGKADFFARVTTTLWLGTTPNSIRSNTSGLNGGAAWSGVTSVDASAKNITDLLSYNNALYIMKEDRPFYLNSSGVVQLLTNNTASIPAGYTNYGDNAVEWQGRLYMIYGNALLEYDISSGDFRWLSPKDFSPHTDYDNDFDALACDDKYLYLVIDNGTNNTILAGRDEIVDSASEWVWHPIQYVTGIATEVAKAWDNILWLGGNASGTFKYMEFGTYLTGGYFETQWLHADFKGDDKAFIKLTLNTEDCTANIYWTAKYKKLNDSSWTTIGNYTTSPSQSRYIPVDGSSVNPVSRYIKFQFTGVTNSTASTPLLRSYDCRAVLYPSRRKIIRCVVRGADEITDKQGTKIEANAALIETVLQEVANATYPVTFYDPWGTTKTVKLMPIKPFYTLSRQEKDRNPERLYNLVLMEVTTS